MKNIILIFITIGAMHTVHANSEPIETEIAEEAEIPPSKDTTPIPVRRSERIAHNTLKKKENELAFLSSDEKFPEEEPKALPIKKKRGRPPKKKNFVVDEKKIIDFEQKPEVESLDTQDQAIEVPLKEPIGRPKKILNNLAPEHPLDVPNSFPSQDIREDTKIPDTTEELVKDTQQEPSFVESLKNKTYAHLKNLGNQVKQKAYLGLSKAGSSLKDMTYAGGNYLKDAAQHNLGILGDKVKRHFPSSQDIQPEPLNPDPVKEVAETLKKGRSRPKKPTALSPETIVSTETALQPSFTERLKQKMYSGVSQAGTSLKHHMYKGAGHIKDSAQDHLNRLGGTIKDKTYSGLEQVGSTLQDRASRFKNATRSHLQELGNTIQIKTAPYRYVPQNLKNLASNISYRYFKKSGDAVKNAYALFKNYTDVATRVMQHVESDAGKVANVVIDATTGAMTGGALGALTGLFTSAAKGVAGLGVESINPAITLFQTANSLKHLIVILKTFFSFYQAVEDGGINFISDTGRNIKSLGKHALNFFKDPEEFKAIVDNYVLEKYFKWIIRLGIFSFGIVQAIELALPEIATIPELGAQVGALAQVLKRIPDAIITYFDPVTQSKSWGEKAIALKDLILNSNVQMKKMQKFVLNTQSKIVTSLNGFALMNEKEWEESGYPGVSGMLSGFKTITTTLSSGIGYETNRLDKAIWVNETVADIKETASNVSSALSDAASAVSDAASGTLNTVKNWVY